MSSVSRPQASAVPPPGWNQPQSKGAQSSKRGSAPPSSLPRSPPARGRVVSRNADDAITAALGPRGAERDAVAASLFASPHPLTLPKKSGLSFRFQLLPADHLFLGLRLLAPRTVEHEDFRQPAEMRDRLDELHRLSAVGTQGRSRCIGQHKRRLCRLRRGTLILIKVEP